MEKSKKIEETKKVQKPPEEKVEITKDEPTKDEP